MGNLTRSNFDPNMNRRESLRRRWELIRLAVGGLRRTPLRVALTSAGVAIATGALLSMVGFALGIQERVEEPFQRSELLNRLDVTSAPTSQSESGGNSNPRNPVVLDDAAVTQIAALPGIALAYPELHLDHVEIVRGDFSRETSATGLPPAAARLPFVRNVMVAGRFFQSTGANELILGLDTVKMIGYQSPADAVGKSVTLYVKGLAPSSKTDFQFESRRIDLQVVGVWDPPRGNSGFTSEGLLLPLDLIRQVPTVQSESTLERLFTGQSSQSAGYHRVVVRMERAADLFIVEKRIAEMGFKTHSFLGQIKEIRQAFVIMDLVLTAVGTVALVVAGLGIINTLLIAVLERYREIGTYKALGASDGDIRLVFLTEAGFVGVLGGLGGLALGRAVSWILEIVVNALARQHGIDEPVMVFAFPWHLLGAAFLFAVIVSLISGVYPASRAARVDPIRALRTE
jgi:putative ABC transport system permease protein